MHIMRASEAHAMPRLALGPTDQEKITTKEIDWSGKGLDDVIVPGDTLISELGHVWTVVRVNRNELNARNETMSGEGRLDRYQFVEGYFKVIATGSAKHTASADPSTVAGVTELITRAGLNPYHYFLDEIAARVRDAIADSAATTEDGGDGISEIAADEFFEWVYEADKGPYGPNLYESNPGDGMSPVWSRS